MSKIKVMDRALSNLIAAGEVIERPASVVKELVENAIDAGAKKITVAVENAGIRSISVSDDGCGMDHEDALLALEPHGTSKLFSEEGINHISTMGFRGEAVPSIASISKLTIRTRTADDLEGCEVYTEGGEKVKTSPCGCPVGTTIEVRDLFFNTPARRKFMKSNQTEERHIEETVMTLALAHCQTGFRLLIDRKKVIDCAPLSSPELRIREFYGRSFAANMRKVDFQEGEIKVTGLVAAPGFTRPGRREQRLFLNNRPIESLPVWKGIKEGYATIGDNDGRYPPTVLYLQMPPEDFDINVHPAKREVRFKSEYTVTRIVSAAVRNALTGSDGDSDALLSSESTRPSIPGEISVEQILASAQISYHLNDLEQPALSAEFSSGKAPMEIDKDDADIIDENGNLQDILPVNDSGSNPPPAEQSQCDEPVVKIRANIPEEAVFAGNWPTRVIGVFDNTYILGSGNGSLIIIDQHAAHERILFEEICDKIAAGSNISQMLLIPQVIELPQAKSAILLKNRELFRKIGFDFEAIGKRGIMVNSIPANFNEASEQIVEILDATLDELLENSRAKMPVNLEYAARAACKAAVKAHNVLTITEAENLIAKLKQCRQGTLCPHGRPTMITISLRELEKRFWRK